MNKKIGTMRRSSVKRLAESDYGFTNVTIEYYKKIGWWIESDQSIDWISKDSKGVRSGLKLLMDEYRNRKLVRDEYMSRNSVQLKTYEEKVEYYTFLGLFATKSEIIELQKSTKKVTDGICELFKFLTTKNK